MKMMNNYEDLIKNRFKKLGLTDNQFEAVCAKYTSKQNILLSAGAGCGKTFVLSKKVLYILETSDLGIENFLILTFTNNSALEMKQRIKKTIEDEINNCDGLPKEIVEKLKKEVLKVDSSSISTFDSFSNQLVSRYASKLNIKSNFSIVDESIIDFKFRQLVIEKLNDEFKNDNSSIVKYYFDRNLEENYDNFISIIKTLYDYKNKQPNQDDFFEKLKKKEFVSTKNLEDAYKLVINTQFNNLCKYFDNYRELEQYVVNDMPEGISISPFERIPNTFFDRLKKATGFSYIDKNHVLNITCKEQLHNILYQIFNNDFKGILKATGDSNDFHLKKIGRPSEVTLLTKINDKEDNSEEANKRNKEVKDIIEKITKSITNTIKILYLLPTDKSFAEILKINSILLNECLDFVIDIDKKINEYKADIGGYSFLDISNMALSLLEKDKEVRNKAKEKYQCIMVDEYQDSNNLQEELLKILGSKDYDSKHYYDIGNIFMVGDIKQSIYRFRDAVPELFASKLEAYNKDPNNNIYNCKVINMNDNFRSSKNVIDQTNIIFKSIMTKDVGGVKYDDKQCLNSTNKSYSTSDLEFVKMLNFTLDDYTNNDEYKNKYLGSKSASSTLISSEFIAKNIKEIVTSNSYFFPTIPKRKVTYSSFALLFRSANNVNTYIKALNKYQIPYKLDVDQNFKSNSVIVALNSLLIVENYLLNREKDKFNIDEYEQFKRALISCSRSFIFNMYDDVIYKELLDSKKNNLYLTNITVFKTLNEINKSINQYTSLIDIFNILVDRLDIYAKLAYLKDANTAFDAFIVFSTTMNNLNEFGFDLSMAKNYFEYQKDSDSNIKTKLYKTSTDAVTITTLHKSKGLEYDIVFVPELNKSFKSSKSNDAVLYIDEDFGMFLTYFASDREILFNDEDNLKSFKIVEKIIGNDKKDSEEYDEYIKLSSKNEFNNILLEAYKCKNDMESISEEVRILYVGLTRAKFKNAFYFFNKEKDIFDKNKVINNVKLSSYEEMICLPKEQKDLITKLNLDEIPNDLSTYSLLNKDIDIQKELSSSNIYKDSIVSKKAIDPSIFKLDSSKTRASKTHVDFVLNHSMIEKGLKLHAYLESINYSLYPNIDVSFIKSNFERSLIEKFLFHLKEIIIKENISNVSFYQEYDYFDKESKHFGSIDLYLDSKDKGVIIDYKLKNIDDEAYLKQLDNYKNNVSNIFLHPKENISCYLYSIFDGTYKKL